MNKRNHPNLRVVFICHDIKHYKITYCMKLGMI